jgi:ParB-like chromosome segregation protein Spo0J
VVAQRRTLPKQNQTGPSTQRNPARSPENVSDSTPADPERTRVTVEIASLVSGDSPRSQGEDELHIQRLAEAEWPLPPILVHQPSMRIIDGRHRVSAAKRKGFDSIDAYLIDGSDEAIFVVAVQENVAHGLPLSLADRRAAAAKILRTHTHWSDRLVAKTTGISAKTVSALRCATEENQQSHDRLGRDGRVRPLNAAAGRQLAAQLIGSWPNASLREIAQATGISASTVRDVRARVLRGDDPVTASDDSKPHQSKPPAGEREPARRGRHKPSRPPAVTPAVTTFESAAVAPVLRALSNDPALRMNAGGRELLRWLHHHAVSSADSQKIADFVPGHCYQQLVEVARRCSANWAYIADDWARRAHIDRAPDVGAPPESCDLDTDRCG